MAARIATRAQAQQLRDGILDALQKTLELAEAEIVGLKKREEAPPKTRLIPLKKTEGSACPKTGKAHTAGEFCKGCFKPIAKGEPLPGGATHPSTTSQGHAFKGDGPTCGQCSKPRDHDSHSAERIKGEGPNRPDKSLHKNAAMGYGPEAGAPPPAAGAGAMEMAEGPMCPKCQGGSGEHLGAVGGKDVFMCRKCAHEFEGQPMAKAEGGPKAKWKPGDRIGFLGEGKKESTVHSVEGEHIKLLNADGTIEKVKGSSSYLTKKPRGGKLEKDASREGLQLAGAKIPPKLPGAPKLKLPGLTAPAGTVARANQGLTGFKSLAGGNPATPPAIKGTPPQRPNPPQNMHGQNIAEGKHVGWPKGTEKWAKSESSNYKSLAPHLGKSASCLMCKGEEHSGNCP